MTSLRVSPALVIALGNALVVLPLAVDRFSGYWARPKEEVSVLSILTLTQLVLCGAAAAMCYVTSRASGWRRRVWLAVVLGSAALLGAEVAARLFRFDGLRSLASRGPRLMLVFAVLGLVAVYVTITLFRVMPRGWRGFTLLATGMAATATDTLLGSWRGHGPLVTLVGEGCEAVGAALMLMALTWTAIAYAAERSAGSADREGA